MNSKINFIELCERAKKHPKIEGLVDSHLYQTELDLCIKEWKEGFFPRGRSSIGDGLASFFDMYSLETQELFGMFMQIGSLHGLRATDHVWSDRCY